MTLRGKKRIGAAPFQLRIAALVALLILGLFCGLTHHHGSERDRAACAFCHAGVQKPISDLALVLVAPLRSDAGPTGRLAIDAIPLKPLLSPRSSRAPPQARPLRASPGSCAVPI